MTPIGVRGGRGNRLTLPRVGRVFASEPRESTGRLGRAADDALRLSRGRRGKRALEVVGLGGGLTSVI